MKLHSILEQGPQNSEFEEIVKIEITKFKNSTHNQRTSQNFLKCQNQVERFFLKGKTKQL
jgi:uncharacterized protein YehS (DUF1456 family)